MMYRVYQGRGSRHGLEYVDGAIHSMILKRSVRRRTWQMNLYI